MTTGWKLRDEFEAWVKNHRLLARSTEPGYSDDYADPWTEGAWSAWKECHERQKPPAKNDPITKEAWDDACRGLGTKG